MTPKAHITNAKTDTQDCIKQKASTAKETINNVKGQPTGWEKIDASRISDKAVTSKYKRTPTTQ